MMPPLQRGWHPLGGALGHWRPGALRALERAGLHHRALRLAGAAPPAWPWARCPRRRAGCATASPRRWCATSRCSSRAATRAPRRRWATSRWRASTPRETRRRASACWSTPPRRSRPSSRSWARCRTRHFRVVEAPLSDGAGGMEFPGLITVATSLFRGAHGPEQHLRGHAGHGDVPGAAWIRWAAMGGNAARCQHRQVHRAHAGVHRRARGGAPVLRGAGGHGPGRRSRWPTRRSPSTRRCSTSSGSTARRRRRRCGRRRWWPRTRCTG